MDTICYHNINSNEQQTLKSTTMAGFTSGGGTAPTGGFSFGTTTNEPANSSGNMTSTIFGGNGGTTRPSPTDTSNAPKQQLASAIAWDPTGTVALSICPSHKNNNTPSSSNEKEAMNLDVFLSHDGTGCPDEETTCLLEYLDARDEWIASATNGQSISISDRNGAMARLSKDYRAALTRCIEKLEEKNQRDAEKEGEDDEVRMGEKEGDDGTNDNLELLDLTSSLSYLVEIFLLPSASSGGSRFKDPNTTTSKLDGPSGSLTADTVRYLRHHHANSNGLLDNFEVAEMLDSDQPEYYKFPASSTPPDLSGPYEYPYWNLLLHLVRRGDLEMAWHVLSHHSGCRHAEKEAMADWGEEHSAEFEGFASIRSLLLSAPIPGGRGDGYCDNSGLLDHLDGDELEEEEEKRLAQGPGEQYDEDALGMEVEDINAPMMQGVPRNAYLLWEPAPRQGNRLRTLRYRGELRRCGQWDANAADESLDSLLLPEGYQPRAAQSSFQTWQDIVRQQFPNTGGIGSGDSSLSVLFRRFPQLEQILSTLLGVVHPHINNATCHWSEVLLSELLYSRPEIMPDDIAIRAKVAMSSCGELSGLDEIILSIMKGNAADVVTAMFTSLGGLSGAALPATVVRTFHGKSA
jgi:hypothetical protein